MDIKLKEKISEVCACSHPKWQGACSRCIAKKLALKKDKSIKELKQD
tara:strand:+ start:750 stop:890 length:141 start_codon:yes stop_codon:yes gene_type:complete